MAKATIQPISEQAYREANQALGMIIQVRELIAKAKACGIDTSEEESYFDAQEENFQQIKAQFFPNKP